MQIAEPVMVAFVKEEPWECPFSHSKKSPANKDNVMPPVDGKDKNDSKKLGSNLADNSDHKVNLEIELQSKNKRKKYDVQYTPHHLIPGNEAWPETELLKWVDESKGLVNADIGYDVNDYSNGIDLPGIHGLGSASWSSHSAPFQAEYAFAAMAASKPKRQFHDRHPKYSSFVVNTLDAIAEKLDSKLQDGPPGCGKKNCGGAAASKPYDVPNGLHVRIENVATRLGQHLSGSEKTWKMPIFTSRFSLMYAAKAEGQQLSQQDARDALSDFELNDD
jgi:hypothetical protein